MEVTYSDVLSCFFAPPINDKNKTGECESGHSQNKYFMRSKLLDFYYDIFLIRMKAIKKIPYVPSTLKYNKFCVIL